MRNIALKLEINVLMQNRTNINNRKLGHVISTVNDELCSFYAIKSIFYFACYYQLKLCTLVYT